VDAGGLLAARYLEHLALLWITVALRRGDRRFAFGLLRDPS
jgi:predicted dinucleotide-binding enzyme